MPYVFHKHKIFPYFKNGRFNNHPGESKPHVFLPSIGMLVEWYFCKYHEKKVDVSHWLEKAKPHYRSDELKVTWVGHSTFLIQVGGVNILTDPIFGNLSALFPRILPPGIELADLPPIDVVLISHNHRDHMDAQSLMHLKNGQTVFMVPHGDKKWFQKKKFDQVIDHMWWDQHTLVLGPKKSPITFTFLPAHHWSQRGLFDYNTSLWGSWMITYNGMNFYFAGDTAYSSHFSLIGKEFPLIDVACMPIGPCEPRQWMREAHVSAEEAGQGFLELNARHFIPMHWGTYYFGIDNFHVPHDRILKWWENQSFEGDKQLHMLKFGQMKEFDLLADKAFHPQAPSNLLEF